MLEFIKPICSKHSNIFKNNNNNNNKKKGTSKNVKTIIYKIIICNFYNHIMSRLQQKELLFKL